MLLSFKVTSHSKREYQSKIMIYLLKSLGKRQQFTIKHHFDKLLYLDVV